MTIRLEVAILLGTILSLVTYLYRTSKPAIRMMGFDSDGARRGRSSSAPTSRRRCPSARS